MKTVSLAFCLLAGFVVSACESRMESRIDANKTLIYQFAAAVDAEDWDTVDALVSEDIQRHSRATTLLPKITSRDQFKEYEQSLHVPFPDGRVQYEMMIAEGDMVAAYANFSGTNTGPIGEQPPTGKSVEIKFLAMFRVENEKIAEIWVEWDNLSRINQLAQ